ncbi:nucleotidyltransferase family protein [Winogradskyella sp. PE311]|uniref:nucleotidyltransferase family protein n=1 Tax=Winogradskyella sp. PE311 TaxID=3366943 RepID=UPI00397FBAE0
MGNITETYQNIADILSFETQPSYLEKKLKNSKFNWDYIVTEGSKHLILPAIYCRLKAKGLLKELPHELKDYLEILTDINRNRNVSITTQALKISQLLKEHKINHVFLKGTALLTANYYEDSAERMIGDIDILIEKNHIHKASKIIESSGYTSADTTIANTFIAHRHMPRLISKDHICAIELHDKLFNKFVNKNLVTENILNQKNIESIINTPSKAHLFLHNMLNHQINNNGHLHKTFSFRSLYDSVLLLEKHDFKHLTEEIQKKPLIGYIYSLNYFFKPLEILDNQSKNILFNYFIRYPLLHKNYIKLVRIISISSIMVNRGSLFLSNSNYRIAILNDRKRIINNLKTMLLFKK